MSAQFALLTFVKSTKQNDCLVGLPLVVEIEANCARPTVGDCCDARVTRVKAAEYSRENVERQLLHTRRLDCSRRLGVCAEEDEKRARERRRFDVRHTRRLVGKATRRICVQNLLKSSRRARKRVERVNKLQNFSFKFVCKLSTRIEPREPSAVAMSARRRFCATE